MLFISHNIIIIPQFLAFVKGVFVYMRKFLYFEQKFIVIFLQFAYCNGGMNVL